MARPVRFNLNPKDFTDRGINQVELPDGHMGEGFFATSFDKVVGLARKNSIWPKKSIFIVNKFIMLNQNV